MLKNFQNSKSTGVTFVCRNIKCWNKVQRRVGLKKCWNLVWTPLRQSWKERKHFLEKVI